MSSVLSIKLIKLTISTIFTALANAIKTDTEPELLPNISTHILRHTACTRMAEKGINPPTLQNRKNLVKNVS